MLKHQDLSVFLFRGWAPHFLLFYSEKIDSSFTCSLRACYRVLLSPITQFPPPIFVSPERVERGVREHFTWAPTPFASLVREKNPSVLHDHPTS